MKNAASRHLRRSEESERAIRRHVCAHCIDLGEDGTCHSPDPAGCAIFRFIPELVSIIKRVHATRMDPYIRAVRRDICTKCDHQRPGGKCEMREALDCGLDRYLALVVDVLDETVNARENEPTQDSE